MWCAMLVQILCHQHWYCVVLCCYTSIFRSSLDFQHGAEFCNVVMPLVLIQWFRIVAQQYILLFVCFFFFFHTGAQNNYNVIKWKQRFMCVPENLTLLLDCSVTQSLSLFQTYSQHNSQYTNQVSDNAIIIMVISWKLSL